MLANLFKVSLLKRFIKVTSIAMLNKPESLQHIVLLDKRGHRDPVRKTAIDVANSDVLPLVHFLILPLEAVEVPDERLAGHNGALRHLLDQPDCVVVLAVRAPNRLALAALLAI